jgi:hypothetical protein
MLVTQVDRNIFWARIEELSMVGLSRGVKASKMEYPLHYEHFEYNLS